MNNMSEHDMEIMSKSTEPLKGTVCYPDTPASIADAAKVDGDTARTLPDIDSEHQPEQHELANTADAGEIEKVGTQVLASVNSEHQPDQQELANIADAGEIEKVGTQVLASVNSEHQPDQHELASTADAVEVDKDVTQLLPAIDRGHLFDQDTLATTADAVEIDEDVTQLLPAIDRKHLLNQNTFRTAFFTGPFTGPLSLPGLESFTIADEQTWLLPAIPKPGKAAKQTVLPETEKEQTSSGTQSYLSLAFDMIKSSGILCSGCFCISACFPCTYSIFN